MGDDRLSDQDPETCDQPVHIEIDGVLDLHGFSPKDLKTLIPDYIDECLARGIREIRLIHGKGIGNVRRSVHALLARNTKVISFYQPDNSSGGWGATIARLKAEKNG
ncbi:Smr/MutS family protein [Desulforhopalus singaporensis]|uniref:Smr domain-containing protein n=1 Tax=Desulforhopalus singaporensis TaxID=91360 RepID=A0A1H0PJ51_9BACT|nr:Smr/MutS family protein [Desulforhopalus singaporensis]SDP05033.1 Smr domain-containing protein [Desulforhopalus singaporensis]